VLAGTFRPDRHLDNPEAPEGRPEPPGPLNGEAAAEWGRTLDRLTAQGILSTIDDALIYSEAQTCVAASRRTRMLSRQHGSNGSPSMALELNTANRRYTRCSRSYARTGWRFACCSWSWASRRSRAAAS